MITNAHGVPIDVEMLWSIEQIKQLKARYWRHMDQRDWELLRELFTADCEFRFGPADHHVRFGGEAIVEFIRSQIEPGVTVHHGHAPEIELTGRDTATGIWALYDHVDAHAPRHRVKFEGYGHYIEQYRRVDNRWLISASTLTRLRVDEPTT